MKKILWGILKILAIAVAAILFGACIVCLYNGTTSSALGELFMACFGWR